MRSKNRAPLRQFTEEENMKASRNSLIGAAASLSTVAVLSFFAATAHGQDAAALYKSKCAACHGADAKGETPIGKANKVRDLASPDVQKQADEDLTAVIANGKNKMPGYAKSLKPEQIKALVAFIRSLKK
jgi:mono/diheme cytochrome c family protein